MRISDWSSDVGSSDRDASRDRIIGCECTGLQQIEHGIADQPTVNMQISVICQAAQHGTGYLAQPGLEGRAVTHPGSNMARDGHGNRIGVLVGVCSSKRFHGLDKGCQRRKWNAWLSVRARQDRKRVV